MYDRQNDPVGIVQNIKISGFPIKTNVRNEESN